jgi:hypothetical protein
VHVAAEEAVVAAEEPVEEDHGARPVRDAVVQREPEQVPAVRPRRVKEPHGRGGGHVDGALEPAGRDRIDGCAVPVDE